jgi:hypothetical protein
MVPGLDLELDRGAMADMDQVKPSSLSTGVPCVVLSVMMHAKSSQQTNLPHITGPFDYCILKYIVLPYTYTFSSSFSFSLSPSLVNLVPTQVLSFSPPPVEHHVHE